MSVRALADLMSSRRAAVLTGAGVSTDSGIPDYRGPDSPARVPITYQQFVNDSDFRRRYWARNHAGWQFMDRARPNDGHRALASLEAAGAVTGLITQNVDRLHQRAGSRAVIELHGHYTQVVCLQCRTTTPRTRLHERLTALNPSRTAGTHQPAPDADAVVADTDSFVVADCEDCDGLLKPDIVYFGENVPKPRVAQAYAMVDAADLIVVVGSSLTVMSGLRFVRHATKSHKPVVIVNRGATRGDDMADLKLDEDISETLTALTAFLIQDDAGSRGVPVRD